MPILSPMTYSDLIKHFGTQMAAAKALRLSQPSVYGWKDATIPFDRQCQIEVATGGKLKASRRHDSRKSERTA